MDMNMAMNMDMDMDMEGVTNFDVDNTPSNLKGDPTKN
jgi:hypothetical protein